MHSGLVLMSGAAPLATITGILVDIFAGFYLLFQGLVAMQALVYEGGNCRVVPPYPPRYPPPPPPSLQPCYSWLQLVQPFLWIAFTLTFLLGYVNPLSAGLVHG
jgi:hypothetical protein